MQKAVYSLLGDHLSTFNNDSDASEVIKRDKANLDIFGLKDDTLEDSDNLPAPEILAQEIADDLTTALEQFANIAAEF